jgi:hypothetical protein
MVFLFVSYEGTVVHLLALSFQDQPLHSQGEGRDQVELYFALD